MILSAYPDTGCTYETTFPCVFERTFRDLCLDVDRQFSNGFLEEFSTLPEPSFSKLGCHLPEGLTECKNLRDLVLVFYSIARNLGLGDAASPGCGRVSDKMFIEYVYQQPDGPKSAKTFHHHDQPEIRQSGGPKRSHPSLGASLYDLHPPPTNRPPSSLLEAAQLCLREDSTTESIKTVARPEFLFDRTLLHQRVKPMLDYWHDLKPMAGPMDMEDMSRKCGSCPFAKECPQRCAKHPKLFDAQEDLGKPGCLLSCGFQGAMYIPSWKCTGKSWKTVCDLLTR